MRETSCAVPETDDLNLLTLAIQLVDDAIGTANNLAKIRAQKFRHSAADFREVYQTFGAGDQFESKPGCGIWFVLGDIANTVRKVSLG